LDIENLKPVTREVEIVHPGNGKEVGLTVHLCSVQDERVRPIIRQIEDRRIVMERTKKRGFNAEEQRQNAISIISACVTGWNWHTDGDGQPGSWGGTALEYSPVNVAKIVGTDWLRKQLDDDLEDTASFFSN
jgi:hypothetical protein